MFSKFLLAIGAVLVSLVSGPFAQAIDWSQYDHLDPKHIIPDQALKQALMYYDEVKDKISTPNYLTVIDFTQKSNLRRFYLVNMKSGAVENLRVAHGQGSDANHDGWAERFSNKPDSKATSIGFYITSTTYQGQHGLSLKLDGLSITNNNARSRAIVVHGASYVTDSAEKIGRSWGCPALDQTVSSRIIQFIKGGSLIYAWGGQTTNTSSI